MRAHPPILLYLPDFLVNANRFYLGFKQSGVALDDVVLLPWAKEFIRLHRAALESDYVSQHLHEWIDLIFGCKQQGPAAVEAVNLFHPLFYEGNVDIYSIEDPLKKNAVIGFINNFGQTPKQLFKKPHPAKKVSSGLSAGSRISSGIEKMALPLVAGQAAMQILPIHLSSIGGGSSSQGQETAVNAVRIFFHHVDHLSPSLQPVKEVKRPVGHMVCVDRSVVVVLSVAVVIFPAPNTKMSEKFSPRRFQLLERAMELFLCYKSDPVLRVQQTGGAQLHSEEVGRIVSEMDPVSREFGGSDATVARPKKKKPMAVQVFNCFLVIRFFSFVILLWISNRTKLAIIENENYLIDVVSWPTCAASLRNPPRPACGPFTWAKEDQRPSLSSYLLDRPGLLPLPKENNLPNSSRNCSCCSCTRPVNR